jgi:nitrate reductase NapAB chaperone NapD
MADQHHVVSLNIWLRVGQYAQVRASIDTIHNADFLWSDGVGKMVATLRARSEEELADGLRAIGSIKDVLNVARIYHQIEDEPATATQRNKAQRHVPRLGVVAQVNPVAMDLPLAWRVRAS